MTNPTKFIDPVRATQILAEAGNTIVQIEFIKKTTGERRVLNGLLHVGAYVKGTGAAYDFKARGLHTVFDLSLAKHLPEEQRAKAYRCFSINHILSITARGTKHFA